MAMDHDPSDRDRDQTGSDSDRDQTGSDSDRERMGYAILNPARRDGEEAREDDRSPSESAGLPTVRPLFRVDTGE